jgi:hypothetical protein
LKCYYISYSYGCSKRGEGYRIPGLSNNFLPTEGIFGKGRSKVQKFGGKTSLGNLRLTKFPNLLSSPQNYALPFGQPKRVAYGFGDFIGPHFLMVEEWGFTIFNRLRKKGRNTDESYISESLIFDDFVVLGSAIGFSPTEND